MKKRKVQASSFAPIADDHILEVRNLKVDIAVDFKSSYYTDEMKVNGLTLGSYWGYFRNRNIKKNTMDICGRLWEFFRNEQVYYQDNDVGEIVRNYLIFCGVNAA